MINYQVSILQVLAFLQASITNRERYLSIHIGTTHYIYYQDSNDHQEYLIDVHTLQCIEKNTLIATYFGHMNQSRINKTLKGIETSKQHFELEPIKFNSLISIVYKLTRTSDSKFKFHSSHFNCEVIPLYYQKKICNLMIMPDHSFTCLNERAGYVMKEESEDSKFTLIASPYDIDHFTNCILTNDPLSFKQALLSRELELSEELSISSVTANLILELTKLFDDYHHTIASREGYLFMDLISEDPLQTNKKLNKLNTEIRDLLQFENESMDPELEDVAERCYTFTYKRTSSKFELSLLATYGNLVRINFINSNLYDE